MLIVCKISSLKWYNVFTCKGSKIIIIIGRGEGKSEKYIYTSVLYEVLN